MYLTSGSREVREGRKPVKGYTTGTPPVYIYIYSTVQYYTEQCCVEWRIRMLFTLLLTALTATSGEDTHTTVRGRDTC